MLKIFTAALYLLLCGCMTINYKDGSGREVKVERFIFDMKVGKIEAQTKEGDKITVDNYDSSSKALDVASKALDTINSVK